MNSMGRFHPSPPAAWARWPVQSRPDVLPRAPERARILPRKTWALKIVGNSCGCLGKTLEAKKTTCQRIRVGTELGYDLRDLPLTNGLLSWEFLWIFMNSCCEYTEIMGTWWNLGNIVRGYLMGIWCEHWVYHKIVNLPIEDILGIYLSIFPGEIVETWDILYQN